MPTLSSISNNIEALARHWSQLAVTKGWAPDQKAEEAAIATALLETAFAVLTADGPLNAFESLLLAQLFGSSQAVELAEHRVAVTGDILGESLPRLISVVQALAAQPDYRPDKDSVLAVLSDILDVGLAADKFPSEAEAWAASRVLSKLRKAVVAKPLYNLIKRPLGPDAVPVPHVQHSVTAPAKLAFTSPSATDEGAAVIRSLLLELTKLVGLDSVKEEVETLTNLARVREMRKARGLPSPDISYHLVFSGNPGTGKTTVARILGQVYGALGLLSTGKCNEVDRSAIIGGYLGQTTTKTIALLERSLGNVLFIDEAYSLTQGHADQYGEEAIAVIIKFMEDHRNDLVVIAAGYTDEMESFLNSNPGLRSRFARTIHFPDYDLDELVTILERMSSADGYRLEKAALAVVREELAALLDAKTPDFANAREVRKIYERAIGQQANRLAGSAANNDELRTLLAEDF